MQKRYARILGLFAALALGAVATKADALVVLDQDVSVTGSGGSQGIPVGPTFGVAETFTVGVAGTLNKIAVALNDGGGVAMELHLLSTTAGVPTFTVLASASATSQAQPGLTVFDFSGSNIVVAVGEVLAFQPIVLAGISDWPLDTPDNYAGGTAFSFTTNVNVNTWAVNNAFGLTYHAGFQSFVDDGTPVVEPGSLALFPGGLAGVALARRRRTAERRGAAI